MTLIIAILHYVHLHSRSDRLLLLLWSGSRSREHLQVVAAGKRLSNRHASQDTNRVRKAPPEINPRAEMQDSLGVTDPQMEAVERALTIPRTTSLDQLFQDGNGSTLHELIADDQNSNNLVRLDCDLAAEAIEQRLLTESIEAKPDILPEIFKGLEGYTELREKEVLPESWDITRFL